MEEVVKKLDELKVVLDEVLLELKKHNKREDLRSGVNMPTMHDQSDPNAPRPRGVM